MPGHTPRMIAAAGLILTAGGAARAQPWVTEQFADVAALPGAGWVFHNSSSPLGPTGWYQGSPEALISNGGFIASDFLCGSGEATLSNWLILPPRTFYLNDRIMFGARTLEYPATYPDRLQLRMSTAGSSANVGASATDVGDFTTLLIDINPTYTATGFPGYWQSFEYRFLDVPADGVTGRLAFRYFVEDGGPDGARGTMVGIDYVSYQSQGPSGACCFADGSCTFANQLTCTSAQGTWRGEGTLCATANCPLDGSLETADVGSLPSTAKVVRGDPAQPLVRIVGSLSSTDVDTYRIRICDRAAFSAVTVQTLKALFLFDLSGHGVVMDEQESESVLTPRITGLYVPADGQYYLSVASSFGHLLPLTTGSLQLWNATNDEGLPYPEWAPNGQGRTGRVISWGGLQAPSSQYDIRLTGACFVGPECYANCDQSTVAPVLNVNDFNCFLNLFATGDSAANCDGSLTPPSLNANDFQCFLYQYTNGCP